MYVLVAPSGECLRGEGLVWLIGAVVVVCSLAAAAGPLLLLARSMDGGIALHHHWLLPINCDVPSL